MEAPLVVIGGTLCDRRVWQPALRCAALAARHVVAGTTADGRPGDPRMPAYAARLLADLPPRFALAGFSLGGMIALEMAAQEPERITRLALVGAGARAEAPDLAGLRRAGLARVAAIGLAAHVRDDLWTRYTPRSPNARRDIMPLLMDMAKAVGLAAYEVQIGLALSRADSLPRLAGLAAPVLLVTGDADRLCPPELHDEMAERLPASRRAVLPCGHLVPLEQPHALGALLRDWMNGPSR